MLLLLVGVVIGMVGAFVQAQRWTLELPWGVTVVPWGPPLVWVALGAAIRGGAWLVLSRWGAWAVVVGWLGATVLVSSRAASGDIAFSEGGQAMAYLVVGTLLAAVAASVPVPRRNLPVS